MVWFRFRAKRFGRPDFVSSSPLGLATHLHLRSGRAITAFVRSGSSSLGRELGLVVDCRGTALGDAMRCWRRVPLLPKLFSVSPRSATARGTLCTLFLDFILDNLSSGTELCAANGAANLLGFP